MSQEVNTSNLGAEQFSTTPPGEGVDEEISRRRPAAAAADDDDEEEDADIAKEEKTKSNEPNKKNDVGDVLKSFHPDKPMDPTRMTEVEQLAFKIEERRNDRILVVSVVRREFLHHCHKLAVKRGFKHKITEEDLIAFRDETRVKVERTENSLYWKTLELFKFRNPAKQLLQVLDRAVDRVENETKSGSLYFLEFSYHFTKLESRWPWMRNPIVVSFMILFLFYFFSWVLFCPIMNEPQVCPDDVEGEGSYAGWLTTLYFASTTLSTVGYGDVTLEKDERWKVFIATLYMLISAVILVTAFSNAMSSKKSPILKLYERLAHNYFDKYVHDQFLYVRIRFVVALDVLWITLQFFSWNLLGIFVARAFVNNSVEEEQWTWMTTLYWSVQTTTTIGYGDLAMPFDMRWFQIFYLLFSTYSAGDALGRIAALPDRIKRVRAEFAWDRREVSKGMVEDWQAEEHDDRIDQYEFIVASLLTLKKIDSDDVKLIMDKFRALAGPDGYISLAKQDLEVPATKGEVMDSQNVSITAVQH